MSVCHRGAFQQQPSFSTRVYLNDLIWPVWAATGEKRAPVCVLSFSDVLPSVLTFHGDMLKHLCLHPEGTPAHHRAPTMSSIFLFLPPRFIKRAPLVFRFLTILRPLRPRHVVFFPPPPFSYFWLRLISSFEFHICEFPFLTLTTVRSLSCLQHPDTASKSPLCCADSQYTIFSIFGGASPACDSYLIHTAHVFTSTPLNLPSWQIHGSSDGLYVVCLQLRLNLHPRS